MTDASMTQIRDLIRSMQGYIQAPGQADLDFVRDESVAYNDLCHEANVRLGEVAVLIDKGLREEALQLATKHDDLLGLFEILDFPQREAWIGLVDSFMLQTPPELDYESATKLNAVHAELAELDPLLRKHRLLNLARAPLPQRIAALNKLHSKDPQNPIWPADAATLQLTRVDQLQEEVDQAIARKDASGLQLLKREVASTKWWVEVPKTLKHRISAGLKNFEKRGQHQRLVDEAAALEEAYAAYDVQKGGRHAAAIRSLAAELQLADDASIWEQAGPALQWVDQQQAEVAEQERAARLIFDLESALDNDANRDTIAQRLAAAEGLGERLPIALVQRARDRVESFEMVARRKSLMGIAAGALVLIATAAGIGFFVIQRQKAAELQSLETTFTKMIDEERFEEADRYYNSLDETVQSRAVFMEGREKIRAAIGKELERRESFAKLLEQIKADQSGQPQYDLISELRRLAVSDSEKAEVASQEAIAENLRLKAKQALTEQQSARLDEVSASVDAFFADKSVSPKRRQNLVSLQEEIAEFIVDVKTSNQDLAETASQLSKLLESEALRMKRDSAAEQAIQRLTSSVGEADRFFDVAEQLVADQPGNAMLKTLIANRESVSKSIAKTGVWIALRNHAASANPVNTSTNNAQEWLSLHEKASKLAPSHPLSSGTDTVKSHLAKMQKRTEAIKQLRSIGTSRLLSTMWVYRDPEDGAKYFSKMTPDRDDAKAHVVSYYADASLLERTENFGLNYATTVKPNVKLAAHSFFSQKAEAWFKELQPNSLTETGYKMIDDLSRMDVNATDPLFKAFLLKKFLEILCPASEPLAAGYQSLLNKMNASKIDWTVNWLTPGRGDPKVNEARRTATQLLSDMGDLNARRQSMSSKYMSIKRGLSGGQGNKLDWVGWVTQTNGQWIAMLKTPCRPAELRVIVNDKKTSGELVNVSADTSDTKQTAVTVANERSQKIGQPVYRVQ